MQNHLVEYTGDRQMRIYGTRDNHNSDNDGTVSSASSSGASGANTANKNNISNWVVAQTTTTTTTAIATSTHGGKPVFKSAGNSSKYNKTTP